MEIENAFIEIKREAFKTSLLHAVLDSSIAVLIVNLFFFLLNLGPERIIVSIAVGGFLFVINFRMRYKNFKLKTFEMYNPQVAEMLRTAYDNKDRKDDIAKSLFSTTIKKLRLSSTYMMINHKKAIIKISSLFVISLATMTLTIITIEFPDLGFDEQPEINIETVKILTDNSIFGEKEDIQIGERELELILSASSNINIDEIKNIEEIDFQRENFPTEIIAQGEITSDEELPEDFELIKNYNLRIRGLK